MEVCKTETTKNHIDEWTRKQTEEQIKGSQEGEQGTNNMLENLEKLQAQFDFKEYMDGKHLPIDKTALTFAAYPTLGEHPFNEKTDKLTIFLCYILLAMGYTLNLQTLSKTELTHVLQEFQEKTVTHFWCGWGC